MCHRHHEYIYSEYLKNLALSNDLGKCSYFLIEREPVSRLLVWSSFGSTELDGCRLATPRLLELRVCQCHRDVHRLHDQCYCIISLRHSFDYENGRKYLLDRCRYEVNYHNIWDEKLTETWTVNIRGIHEAKGYKNMKSRKTRYVIVMSAHASTQIDMILVYGEPYSFPRSFEISRW